MGEESKLPKKAIVDASFVLNLLLPDEKTEKMARRILISYQEGKITFFAPKLLDFEVVNGLRSAVKRKRITRNFAQKLVKEFSKLHVNYQEIDLIKALKLALKLNLSVYDACYLTLSRQLKRKLLTSDKKMAAF